MTELELVSIPYPVYLLAFGVALTFVSFWLKSYLVYGAIAMAMLGIIFEPVFLNTWMAVAAAFMLMWAVIGIISVGRRGSISG